MPPKKSADRSPSYVTEANPEKDAIRMFFEVEKMDVCLMRFGSWTPCDLNPVLFQRNGIVFSFSGVDQCNQVKLEAKDILVCEYNLRKGMPTVFIYATPSFGMALRQRLKIVKGSSSNGYFDPLSTVESEKRIIIRPRSDPTPQQLTQILQAFESMAVSTGRLKSDIFKEITHECCNHLLVISYPPDFLLFFACGSAGSVPNCASGSSPPDNVKESQPSSDDKTFESGGGGTDGSADRGTRTRSSDEDLSGTPSEEDPDLRYVDVRKVVKRILPDAPLSEVGEDRCKTDVVMTTAKGPLVKSKKLKLDEESDDGVEVGVKGITCGYYKQCLLIQQAAYLPEALLDLESQYNKCYCRKCHDDRGEGDSYRDGPEPHNLYTKPIGWGRIMLKLPPRADHLKIFKNWNVAYHGTSVDNLLDIIEAGELLIPGDKTMDGDILEEVEGHFNDDNKPDGFNTKQVFLSPSIKYAGCDVYAKKKRLYLYDKRGCNGRCVNVRTVLQVRIKPDQFQVGPETIGSSDLVDFPIDNDAIEWSTEARTCVIPTAVLFQVTESPNPGQSATICPSCRILFTGINHPATRTCQHEHVLCRKCQKKFQDIYGEMCVLCSSPLFQLDPSKARAIRRRAEAFKAACDVRTSRRRGWERITIFLKMLDGKTDVLDFHPKTSIGSIKRAVEARHGLVFENQRILFAGKQLEDGRTLADYKVLHENTLELHIRLRGN